MNILGQVSFILKNLLFCCFSLTHYSDRFGVGLYNEDDDSSNKITSITTIFNICLSIYAVPTFENHYYHHYYFYLVTFCRPSNLSSSI